MKLAASTESLRTWQRRSEHTRPVSQRERLPRHDLTDCLLQAYDDLILRAYAWQQFQVIPNYRTAIARNMKGVILAYGLYLAAGLVSLAVRSYADGFSAASNIIEPFSYLVSLSIWLTAMWSYHPNRVPALVIRREADREDWVSRTRIALGAVRSHFAKAAHP